MEADMEEGRKAFIIPGEAWYKDEIPEEECIHIGFYYRDGSTDGEFRLVWDGFGIQLRAYQDSWGALSRMPELIEFMGQLQAGETEPAVQEFAEELKRMGFEDITERERKDR